ncbi:DUF3987 domain-containing protein [Prosthecobacter sp.]|uniref:DUF3987 domain-containing protein n=1 Tax=Prosthecobacter sp. TaxID=1965333 RepID=UPI0037846FC1
MNTNQPDFDSSSTPISCGPPPVPEGLIKASGPPPFNPAEFSSPPEDFTPTAMPGCSNNADAVLPGVQNQAITNSAENAGFDIGENEEDEFPLECLPDIPRRIIAEVSKAVLIPVPLVAACSLGALSSGLGAGVEIMTDGIRGMRPNLFIIAVAASGTGKGRAFKAIMEPFTDYESEKLDRWQNEVLPGLLAELAIVKRRTESLEKSLGKQVSQDTNDGLDSLTSLQRRRQDLEAQLHEPRLSVADATAEALAIALKHGKHEAIASMSSEARGCADVLAGRYNKKSDESIYLAGFSGDPCKYDRIGRPSIQIAQPCLGILWMIQPDKFDELRSKPSLCESGWLPRCLIFDSKARPQRVPKVRHVIDKEASDSWSRLVKDLLVNVHDIKKPVVLSPTPEVSDMFIEYTNELVDIRQPGGALYDVDTYVSRWAELAWRLAIVLHAGLHGSKALEETISTKTASDAIRLMRWFSRQQLQLLSAGREEKKLERLTRLISLLSSEPESTSTTRDMERRHGFTKEEILALAKDHPNQIFTKEIKPTGPGRPSIKVSLLPIS